MPQVAYHPVPPTKVVNGFLRAWGPSLGLWGVGGGILVLHLLSATPLVKREVLRKVPLIGDYWEDKTPPSDKPF
ncbi:hypothetical protein OBBRIDRAFT_788052 [Obba rivulosa]|uniref:Uncharacterized protein n=1 Tax=Obba rivulosa TaxID=1052685 RepID=A0A8E2J687_9APHY|nr:hypothetical protein OBBRIDRAFT_788052 [Obba rivulosa]